MTIAEFDKLQTPEKRELLFSCCGCSAWVKEMLTVFPVEDLIDLLEYAEEKWYDCNPADWLEAFENHPRIGDLESIHKRFGKIAAYTEKEQAGVLHISEELRTELAEANEIYYENFGYNYIVFAIDKTASQMLDNLRSRLENDPREEITIAAAEQDRINKWRLKRLFA